MTATRTGIDDTVRLLCPIDIDRSTSYISPFAVIGYSYDPERTRYYGTQANSTPPEGRVKVGSNVHIGPHSVVSSGARIGHDTLLEAFTFIGENAQIGNHCFIRYRSQIYRRVHIADNCIVGGFLCNDAILEERVTFFGEALHRYLDHTPEIGAEKAPIIRAGAFVAFGAQIIGPVTVGSGAIIKCRSVVSRDVPAHHVVEVGEVF